MLIPVDGLLDGPLGGGLLLPWLLQGVAWCWSGGLFDGGGPLGNEGLLGLDLGRRWTFSLKLSPSKLVLG